MELMCGLVGKEEEAHVEGLWIKVPKIVDHAETNQTDLTKKVLQLL